MTIPRHPGEASPARRQPAIGLTRRAMLGPMAAPVGFSALMAFPGIALAGGGESRAGQAAEDLRPGGAFDKLLAARAAEDQFSGTVLLAQGDRPVLARSFGMANKERSIPNGPDTIFRMASVTKCLTGVAVGQLVQRGAVAFHETVGTYLDGFPPEIAETVTVHQLLTHTSGVGRPPLGPGIRGSAEWDSVEEVWDGTMAVIRQQPLQFTPGSTYAYSNDGYWVLAAIVAQVSGQSYYDYVREHVFARAGMVHSDFYTRPQVLADDRIARRYWTRPAGDRIDVLTTGFAEFIGGPDGGAYATAPDMVRFARALQDGTLLTPLYADLLTRGKAALPPSDLPTQLQFYGYGFLDIIVNDHSLFTHSGSGPGMAANLDVYRDSEWVAVILSNYDTTIEPIVGLERQLITQ
jgi:CubicO group peptidase (beta-lactamase class C family)